MAEEQGRAPIDCRAGFVAALRAIYDDRYPSIETLKEVVLGEKPPRLDAIVLKKPANLHLRDEIGCFFRGYNVVEYKGYGDEQIIREILRVGPHDQVEFLSDGERVQIVAVPKDSLSLGDREDFWESVTRADEDYFEGRITEVHTMTNSMRARYGL